ncbi:MAG TPA: calcium-binding protein [Rhizomicrobium sp.]|jgi:Ca2+-binding RTX toxin-like protein|nr:calcium-binding protein [Rhizomicrobium sp.]
MTAYKITQDSDQSLLIADGDSVVLEAGVSIIDPSVTLSSRQGLTDYAGIQDTDGGDNKVSILGTAEGFVGAWFWEGSDRVNVGSQGLAYGFNAGVEFHDEGHNLLSIQAGGEVSSEFYGVWFGAFPHYDYTTLPTSGVDTIHNAGTIEGIKREAVRMVFGGNHIVNSGTIQADLFQAIQFDSAVTDPRNFITNTGHIVAGPRGPSIVSGDAAMTVQNNGSITGDIQFGAGNDHYVGSGTFTGTIYGGAGNDTLIGGAGDFTVEGGAGADHLGAGSGVNTFVYTDPSESTKGAGIDTITGFDFSRDHIVIAGTALTQFDHIETQHALAPNHAALMETSGVWYLLVDANGVAGYQAGEDYMIKLANPLHMP